MADKIDVNAIAALTATTPAQAQAGHVTPAPGPQPAALHGFRDVLARALRPLSTTASETDADAALAVDADAAPPEPNAEAALRVDAQTAPHAGTEISAAPVVTRALGEADPGDPHTVRRSTELLVPQFRTRLERIIERMRDEFGHEVRVVETYRSSDRQTALYAQGRTAPGPTVTWTRNSQHEQGRAADVIIDGDYGNPVAYERLARVAAAEGVRTLGARDPGHLELSADDATSKAPDASVARATPDRPAAAASAASRSAVGVSGVAQVAHVAQVARTAQVASVAQVARVASVARPGRGAIVDGMDRTPARPPVVPPGTAPIELHNAAARGAASPVVAAGQVPDPAAPVRAAGPQPNTTTAAQSAPVAAAQSAPAAAAADEAGTPFGRRAGRRPIEPGEPTKSSASETETAPLAPSPDRAREPQGNAPTLSVASMNGTDIAGRIARVLALQESALASPTSGVTLLVENAEGSAARIRLGLRGSTVGAAIDLADPTAAHELSARVDELRRALERQGLEAGPLLVRAPTIGREAAETVRIPATAADVIASQGRPAEGNTTNDRNPGSPRRDADSPEHRQKRQSKENPS